MEDDILEQEEFSDFSEEELIHYGIKRRSGRYPWGSGENPFQHSGDFYSYVNNLKDQGFNEKEIARGLGISTTDFRSLYSLDKNRRRQDMISYAKSARQDGKTWDQIGIELGKKYNYDKTPMRESSVRALMNAEAETRMNISMKTAENLKKIVDEKKIVDIGQGVEREIGISVNRLKEATAILEMEGYHIYGARVPQMTNKGKYTTIKVLTAPDVENREIYEFDKIGHLTDYRSDDDGDTFHKAFVYPSSMDSKRLKIRYAEDEGVKKDGLVEIRRGVEDLSLGEKNYAQVRILVDNKYYIKGMAVYSDGHDMPNGVDVIFNSNKSRDVGLEGALKSIDKNVKKDPENPFGSSIKEGGQSYYLDDDGKYKLSLINKTRDEGDWDQWSKELPSQMLSKQPQKYIKRQLDLAAEQKEAEFNNIMEVNNPTVKKAMLNDFADKCDKAAVDLKAAAFPGQKYQVILPLTTIGDDEVYAPNYPDGAELALIRYPHGGTFEIPIVKVNNRNKEGKSVITPNALDAVGISAATASRLSGADFDGDTVMVIPLSDKIRIKSSDPLPGLVGFDPKLEYGYDPKQSYVDDKGVEHWFRNGVEFKPMTDTQREMGVISNLITDMTIKGATDDEKARAVRHSMVVIDAEKHHLDYKQSEIDNGIKALHEKYQLHTDVFTGNEVKGASTLISLSKSKLLVPERKPGGWVTRNGKINVTQIDEKAGLFLDEKTGIVYQRDDVKKEYIDRNTGKKLYTETGNVYRDVKYKDSEGKTQKARLVEQNGELYYKDNKGEYKKVTTEKIYETPVTTTTTKMAEVDDARILSSGSVQEEAYANYANKMKSLANEARKESLIVKDIPYSPSAAKTYEEERKSLTSKLNEAMLNKPRERTAQLIANSEFQAIKKDNPRMTDEEESKQKTRLLVKARARVGAQRKEIEISDKEWEAIQAGAISPTALGNILQYANSTRVKQLAIPRAVNSLNSGEIRRLKSLANRGYTNDEIAKTLGVSASTVVKYLSGKED